MKSCLAIVAALVVFLVVVSEINAADEKKKQLQIGIKKKVENCSIKSKRGDSLHM